MSRTATYNTTVRWEGEHWGHLVMGNGPEMKFSAPPDAHGHAGVLTPEDAFVAAANRAQQLRLGRGGRSRRRRNTVRWRIP
jgi:hypothetical protein